MFAYTAAHRSLPFNTILEVTNLRNEKKVLVRVNDRGPFSSKLILDISKAAAFQLDMLNHGVEKVAIRVLDSAKAKLLIDTLSKTLFEGDFKTTKKQEVKLLQLNDDVKICDGDLKPCETSGYGVQIGYYKNFENCRADLKKNEQKYNVPGFIKVKKLDSSKYFHLIMGDFKSKTEAEKLKLQISKTIPGCFIVSWNKL